MPSVFKWALDTEHKGSRLHSRHFMGRHNLQFPSLPFSYSHNYFQVHATIIHSSGFHPIAAAAAIVTPGMTISKLTSSRMLIYWSTTYPEKTFFLKPFLSLVNEPTKLKNNKSKHTSCKWHCSSCSEQVSLSYNTCYYTIWDGDMEVSLYLLDLQH